MFGEVVPHVVRECLRVVHASGTCPRCVDFSQVDGPPVCVGRFVLCGWGMVVLMAEVAVGTAVSDLGGNAVLGLLAAAPRGVLVDLDRPWGGR